jgi:hypothetical protein
VTKKEIQKLVLIAMLKGFIHAAVMPIALMFLIAHITQSVYSLATPILYVLIASWIYMKSKDKDISKMIFFRTLGVVSVGLMIYFVLIAS